MCGGVRGRGRPRACACSAPRRRRVAGRVRGGFVGVVAPLDQVDGSAEVVPRVVLVVMAHGRRLVAEAAVVQAVDAAQHLALVGFGQVGVAASLAIVARDAGGWRVVRGAGGHAADGRGQSSIHVRVMRTGWSAKGAAGVVAFAVGRCSEARCRSACGGVLWHEQAWATRMRRRPGGCSEARSSEGGKELAVGVAVGVAIGGVRHGRQPEARLWRGGEGGMRAYMCTTSSIVRPRGGSFIPHDYRVHTDDVFTPTTCSHRGHRSGRCVHRSARSGPRLLAG